MQVVFGVHTVSAFHSTSNLHQDRLRDLFFDNLINNKNTETSGYNLRNRQSASFAYGASQAADIKEMKMSGWVTPASLAKKIINLMVN